jgi:hypothetical protein
MAIDLPERLTLEAILTHYCEKRVPLEVRDKIRLTFRIEKSIVTLYEQRPRWDDPSLWQDLDIARFRYVSSNNQWVLYWKRANGRWLAYPDVDPSESIEPLLAEVDKDPHGCFWG